MKEPQFAGQYHEVYIRLLQLISVESSLHDLVREVTSLMQAWSGCEAVGVRLRDGDDYPYFETRGFPARFVEMDNLLCAAGERDAHGNVILECMCGNVIAGRFDPSLPFFTAAGSFWTNSTSDLLASTSEAERQGRTRNRCNQAGYESVALIPLCCGAEHLGLLQFNDRRRNCFTPERIGVFERLAAALAVGLVQRRAVRRLQESEAALRAVLEVADESILMVDRDGVVLDLNTTTARRLGRKKEELIGRCVFDVLPEPVAELRRAQVAAAIASGEPVRFIDQRDSRNFQHAVYPIVDSRGETIRLAIYSQDVTGRTRAETALWEAEKRYRTIIEASPLAIFLVRDARYVYANPEGAAQLGYSMPEDIVGVLVEDTIAPCDLEVARVRMHAATEGRANPPLELDLIRRDGTRVTMELMSTPIRLVDGPAILVMGNDVSVRKQALESVRLQGLVLDQILSRVTITDLEGRITYVNEATCRALKRTAAELIGQSVEILGDDPNRGATQREIIEKTLAEGYWRGDVVNYAADGGESVLDCRAHLVRDPHGRPIAMCGIAIDVTEVRRIERDLRESEQRFRLLHEHLPVGYQSLDAEGRILEVNEAWLATMGYARVEVIGRWFGDFLPAAAVEVFRRNFPLFKERGSVQIELDMVRKDGSVATMFFVGRVGTDATGRFKQTHCIATDITEKRRLEEEYRQAQKMEAVGRLAAGVAHDFNNQLTVIRGYCGILLADQRPGDPLWKPLSEIMRASERARQTTNHLLSFSRRQVLDPRPTNLGGLLKALQHPVATMIGEDINFAVVVAPDVLPVLIDQPAMHQALMNLIVNARDAMPDGGDLILRVANFELDAAARPEFPDAEPGPYVLVEVNDTGCGMSSDDLERLFEPFFTTKPTGKGTGLGMSMVQGFVRQSRGAISVRSQVGRGTTVRIVLPAVTQAVEPEADGPGLGRPKAPRGSETIQVVEDDTAVRSMIVDCLRRTGYQVLEAGTPREAIANARDFRGPLDLIVTDMIMPGMNGVDLAAAIVALHPGARKLYISGYVDQDQRPDVSDLLLKPFGPAELATRVRQALDAPA